MLTSTLLFLQPDPQPTFVKVEVANNSSIEMVEDKPVVFGLKETAEELLNQYGYSPNDTMGMPCKIEIEQILSPQQMLNIIGMKWLKKDYVIHMTAYIGESMYHVSEVRHTYLFAAFLNVEGDEVPLNKKAFGKTLESGLKKLLSFDDKYKMN